MPCHGMVCVACLIWLSLCAVMLLTLVFLQHAAMAESSAVTAAVPERAAPTKLEELLEITAQSLVRAEVAEHYEVIRELGRGKYGHVMLVTHRQRGKELAVPCEAWQGGLPGDQQTGTSPAWNNPITSSQGPGDARGQPRTSGKNIVIKQVQGQARKLIHK